MFCKTNGIEMLEEKIKKTGADTDGKIDKRTKSFDLMQNIKIIMTRLF